VIETNRKNQDASGRNGPYTTKKKAKEADSSDHL